MAFPKSLDAFPAEFFEAFRQGSSKPVELLFEGPKARGQATILRHRLHYLRRLMQRLEAEGHPPSPYLAFANKCEVAIYPKPGTPETWVCAVRPSGFNLSSIFQAAGIGQGEALPRTAGIPESSSPFIPPTIPQGDTGVFGAPSQALGAYLRQPGSVEARKADKEASVATPEAGAPAGSGELQGPTGGKA